MQRLRRWLKSDYVVLPVMIVLILAARSSLADHYHVPTGSMEYTILPGDRIFIDKTAYGLRVPFTNVQITDGREPVAGDIAVFDSPADGVRLIKRIVAVEGDVVSLIDGHLTVNGRPLGTGDAEYFGEHRAALNLRNGGGPELEEVRVPEHAVLAIGDHRGDSLDSRYWGFVDEDALYGLALAIYYRRGDGFTWLPL
jgi:signal peptidase I